MRLSPLALLVLVALPLFAAAAEADAYKAVDERTLKEAEVGNNGVALIAYFRSRIPAEAVKDNVELLIRQLGDDDFLVRENATTALIALGGAAAPLLRLAAKETPDGDVEVIRRAEKILKAIDKVAGPAVSMAAARALARHNPDGACEVLLDYLPYADDDGIAEEVRQALTVVGFRAGRPHKALTEALQDEDVRIRSAATFALIRSGDAELRKDLKTLLKDADPLVRLRAALAFFEHKDKDSLPAMIGVLGELPVERLWAVEDILNLVAGDKAPNVALGSDAAAHQKSREAWQTWWKTEGNALDLAKLDLGQRLKGLTLITTYGPGINGQVFEVGADGATRWQIAALQYPVDAEVVGDNVVVIAEYRRRRVVAMDFKGTVKWERGVASYPTGIQGLPDGNTLIISRNQLLEVDADGKDVKTLNLTVTGILAGARKMPDGGYVTLASTGQVTFLDKDGKTQKSFKTIAVSTGLGGARFDVTPTGRILIPHYTANKVVEYDRDGKEVWSAAVQMPGSVVRLPNGRTLVGSMASQRIVELDRDGREVWEFKSAGRVMSVRKR